MFASGRLDKAIALRSRLRAAGRYGEADRIRDWLTAHGIRVEDYRAGSIWVRDDPWARQRNEPDGELKALLEELDGRSLLPAPD